MIIKANASQGTGGVYETTFHELAHASHYRKVGSSYWIKYINYVITYGSFSSSPYGGGGGHNAEYCGIGEMWGNYFAAVCMDREFRTNRELASNVLLFLYNKEGGYGGEDWYNPGFLFYVNSISDITTAEIFSCLTSSTNTFDKLISQLKTKTEYDEEIDTAWNNYTDWP